MKHYMIDIETMGTRPTSAIVQIGAVEFEIDTFEITRTFEKIISLSSCMREGLTVDASTIDFWMKQSEQVKKVVFNQDVEKDLKRAIWQLGIWMGAWEDAVVKDNVVWANGASFDFPILKNAFEVCGHPAPWHYWNERDCRTIFSLFPEVKKAHFIEGVKHDAVCDCINQVSILEGCFKKMKL